MKVKKNLFIIMIIFLLVLLGCKEKTSQDVKSDNDNKSNLTESGMPIVEEPITLKVFAGKSASQEVNWKDLMIWREYEDRTNVHVEWEQVPFNSLEEKRNLRLASDDLPDVFYAAKIPAHDVYKYGKQGIFIELNDLIDEYAPNFKKLMEEDPSIKDSLMSPDGTIYTLPYLVSPDFMALRTNPFILVNKEWIDKLDMDVPETTEEFYQYLKAVKESNENDGVVVPYGGGGPASNIKVLISELNGAFGLSNKGGGNAHVDLNPKDDSLRFIPTSDAYKELLEYVHKLYSEELIQQNIYSMEHDQYLANLENNLYASTTYYPTSTPLFGDNESISLGPLKGPHDEQLYTAVSHPVLNIGSFAITNMNKNPEATMRWLDFFYSDEGSKFFYMGIEGVTYEETEDGEFKVLEDILTESSLTKSIAKHLAWPGTGAPSIMKQEYFTGGESTPESLEASKKVEPYLIDEVWPEFTYTEDENKELNPIEVDISKYVDEKQAEFITGEKPFAEWDDYVKTLEDIGVEDYMRIKSQAYDRMKENQTK